MQNFYQSYIKRIDSIFQELFPAVRCIFPSVWSPAPLRVAAASPSGKDAASIGAMRDSPAVCAAGFFKPALPLPGLVSQPLFPASRLPLPASRLPPPSSQEPLRKFFSLVSKPLASSVQFCRKIVWRFAGSSYLCSPNQGEEQKIIEEGRI